MLATESLARRQAPLCPQSQKPCPAGGEVAPPLPAILCPPSPGAASNLQAEASLLPHTTYPGRCPSWLFPQHLISDFFTG